MGSDVRLPLGLMCLMIGGLLAAFGALADKAIYARSLGINVNLLWGAFMLVFAAAILWLARRSARRRGAMASSNAP